MQANRKEKATKKIQASHNFRAVIVKLICFALWTKVAITHFDVRLGLNYTMAGLTVLANP